eukprot:gene34161-biopygen17026
MSELRMVELFDDLCESMSKYGLATEDGTPVWVLKAGKKGLATGAKGKAETKDLTSYCGALLEESEESLMEAIQSDELEHTKVADILCKQITHHCKEVVKAPVYTPIPRPGGVKLRVGSISWNDWRMAKPRAFIQCKLCGPDSEELAFSGNTSNMRSHLAHCHKPIFSQICEAEDCAEDPSSGFTQRQGALDSVSAPYYAWKRDALHKKYTLPTYKLAVQNIIKLSVDGLSKVRSEIAELKEEGILPSIAGDIWGEGTVSLLGILGYYITKDFVYKQRVLGPIPVGGVRHAGDEIMTATKKACAHVGIGTFSTTLLSSDEDEDTADTVVVLKDTVCESVHTTTSDQGALAHIMSK